MGHIRCIPAHSLLHQVSFYYDVPDMIVVNDSHCLLVESNAVVKIEGVPGKTGRPRGGGKKRFLLPTPNVRQTRARTRKNADLVTVIPDADVVTVTPDAGLVTVTPGAAPEVFTTLLPEGSVCLGTFTLPLVLSSADEQPVPMETDIVMNGDM